MMKEKENDDESHEKFQRELNIQSPRYVKLCAEIFSIEVEHKATTIRADKS